MRLEFGGAGVDALEDGCDAKVVAGAADVGFGAAGQYGKPGVGEAHHLEGAQPVFGERQAVFADPGFGLDDLADTGKEPRVEHVTPWMSSSDRPSRMAWAMTRMRSGVRLASASVMAARSGAPANVDFVKAGQAGFHRGERLLHDSWKVRPMAMASPTDFIAVVRLGSEPGNFSKAKRGILVTT